MMEDNKYFDEIALLQVQLLNFFEVHQPASLSISPQELQQTTEEFLRIYPQRPIKINTGGTGLGANYWMFVVLRQIKPNLIIESGVWKGQSSWLLRQARPTAEIHAFDICLNNMLHKEPSIAYHECDWIAENIFNRQPNEGLVFFDDHSNQAKRVREAYDRGFKWLLFDDNVPTDQINRIGRPALPSISMLFDPKLKEGDLIRWELAGQEYCYSFSARDAHGAKELIDYHLVFPTYTCITLVKLY
ncbi:MAG: hypothetical protein AUK55_12205 [Syntrophobacteraceae bacterium CG2_30_61_12]|nr:MAG: hypothetical protein AUK55_12205 [Syntrophobacteraceae bacterium CG2_30_61_12]